MKEEDADRIIKTVLVGLVLLAFAIRIYRLDFQSLWRDEVDAIRFAQRSLPEIAADFLEIGHNGPLYYLLLHFWIRLAGTSEFAVRFFSLMFGTLTIPLVFGFWSPVGGHQNRLGGRSSDHGLSLPHLVLPGSQDVFAVCLPGPALATPFSSGPTEESPLSVG
jgi:hypothetical protein